MWGRGGGKEEGKKGKMREGGWREVEDEERGMQEGWKMREGVRGREDGEGKGKREGGGR